jgi:hypothetical protein
MRGQPPLRFVTTAFCATCETSREITLRAGRSPLADLSRLADPDYRARLTGHAAGRCSVCGSTAIDDRRITTQLVKGDLIAC